MLGPLTMEINHNYYITTSTSNCTFITLLECLLEYNSRNIFGQKFALNVADIKIDILPICSLVDT